MAFPPSLPEQKRVVIKRGVASGCLVRWSRLLSTTVVPRCPRCQGERRYKERPPGAWSAAGQGQGWSAHVHAGSQRAAPQGHSQGAGAQRLPGPPEPAGHSAHLRGLLPDGQEVVGGKKRQPCPPSWTRGCPVKAGTCPNPIARWSFVQAKAQTLWWWVALCRRTRQLSSPGRRATAANKARLIGAPPCPGTTAAAPPAATLWRAYRAAFPKRTHRGCAEGRGRDLPRRALVWHFAPARQPPGAKGALLLQMRREPPSTPSTSSSPPTTSRSSRLQHSTNHHLIPITSNKAKKRRRVSFMDTRSFQQISPWKTNKMYEAVGSRKVEHRAQTTALVGDIRGQGEVVAEEERNRTTSWRGLDQVSVARQRQHFLENRG